MGDAFIEFVDTGNVKSDKYIIDGPDVGSQCAIELIGSVAQATKLAQYILGSVKKEDGPPPACWQFQAVDPSGISVPICLNGDKMAIPRNLKESPNVCVHSSNPKLQTPGVCRGV